MSTTEKQKRPARGPYRTKKRIAEEEAAKLAQEKAKQEEFQRLHAEEILKKTTFGPAPKLIAVPDDVAEIPYIPPAFDRVAAMNDPMREIAAQLLSIDSLLAFIKRFRPKYMAGWVHEDICRRLERFMRDVEQGKSPRMLLMMPPRAGKSEIGSRHFAPWVLGHHPDWEIIAASHTSSLSLSFSRYIRDLMEDDAYKVLFPDSILDPNSRSVENWNLRKGGGYLAAGVGTGITGRGAHILLLDDLVKDIEAADSDTIRENTWEWYISTAYTRLAPGGGVLGIMTWWNEDDWAGRIQQVMKSGDGDKFEVVRYPAINEEGDEYLLDDDTIIEILPGDPVPHNVKKFIRPHNTALHPARYDTAAMTRIKNNLIAGGQKRIWSALYQQSPAPDDGLYFTKDMLRFYPSAPARKDCRIYQAWDFAISEGKESDYTVGCTIMVDPKGHYYILDVRRFKSADSIMIVDTILDYFVEYDAQMIGFEDGQIWKAMEAFFTQRCTERSLYPSFEILKPLTDKLVRAAPLRGLMQAGRVWFDEKAHWYRVLHHEMMRFPAGKNDDQVDSLAWCVRLALMMGVPKATEAPPTYKSWKDKLNSIASGKHDISHMAA